MFVINASSYNTPSYFLRATSVNAPPDEGGMHWEGQIESPDQSIFPQQDGAIQLVQLVTPGNTFKTNNLIEETVNYYAFSNNG